MDPLAQYDCPLYTVHTEEDCPPKQHMCKHYQPQPIDEEVYHVVQEEYEKWWQFRTDKWVDFLSEEGTFTRTGWDNMVQRQEQIRSKEKACKRN
jgi:hypothetical protein